MDMTTTLQMLINDVGPGNAFDDEALIAAENKLLQIMMDLATNTGNIVTLSGDID